MIIAWWWFTMESTTKEPKTIVHRWFRKQFAGLVEVERANIIDKMIFAESEPELPVSVDFIHLRTPGDAGSASHYLYTAVTVEERGTFIAKYDSFDPSESPSFADIAEEMRWEFTQIHFEISKSVGRKVAYSNCAMAIDVALSETKWMKTKEAELK